MFSRLQKFFAPKPASALTLLNIFKPFYILLIMQGFFPYNLEFKSKHKCVIIHRSIYVSSVCATSVNLMIIVFMIMHIRGIITLTEGNSLTDVIMTQINYILELFNLTLFCLVAYCCTFINRFNYVNILNTLAEAWTEISNKNNNILIKLKQRLFKTLFILLFLLMIQMAVNYTRQDNMWKKILVTMSFIVPQMVQFTYLAFFYLLIMMLIALLMNIEEQLKKEYIDKNYSGEFFTKVGVRTPATTIRAMELVFVKACEVKRSINEAFQAPILITAMQCFHAMVSEAYIIYHGAVVHRSLSVHEVVNCSIWIIYQLFKIYVLAYSGNLLKIEIFRLGQTLHNVPTEKQDIRTLLEIQHFSTLMSYQATELTVYGYFPLDATLLFKVCASAAMYLIILVQFDKEIPP